jgi:peptide chain release factor 1
MAGNIIIEKLEGVKQRFVEVGEMLTRQEVLSDMEKYIGLNKEFKSLRPIIDAYEKYKLALSNVPVRKNAANREGRGNEKWQKSEWKS